MRIGQNNSFQSYCEEESMLYSGGSSLHPLFFIRKIINMQFFLTGYFKRQEIKCPKKIESTKKIESYEKNS